MKIISGSKKSYVISAPKNLPVRPTSGLVKESLFNILSNYFNFIELFMNFENTNITNLINGTLVIKAFLDLFLISTIFGILVRICINLYNIQRARL